jgi:hypothetical protein
LKLIHASILYSEINSTHLILLIAFAMWSFLILQYFFIWFADTSIIIKKFFYQDSDFLCFFFCIWARNFQRFLWFSLIYYSVLFRRILSIMQCHVSAQINWNWFVFFLPNIGGNFSTCSLFFHFWKQVILKTYFWILYLFFCGCLWFQVFKICYFLEESWFVGCGIKGGRERERGKHLLLF